METQSKNSYAIPVAIVAAGLVIAGAIIFSYSGEKTKSADVLPESAGNETVAKSFAVENLKPITEKDHILGDPNALVKLVEFSDLECPFCKQFHPTMQQIINEYGKDGRVAWIYRHFPLDSIHTKARKEAQATECAAELGGNGKFWEYVDKIFEVTPSNDGLDLSLLPKIAEDIGLDRIKFEVCLEGDSRGGKYAEHIENDFQDAVLSGGIGTPYSIVIAPNGKKFIVNGAQPYAAVKSIIDAALKEI